jgi:Domain of unknown function (DUF5753)/Helix-turn-helix domain
MSEAANSTVPRRQLGRYLRDLRNTAHITIAAAAKQLEWSDAKIWRIETGQTALRSLDVQAMCDLYGAAPDLAEALKGLAKETKGRGWWHSYGDVIPESFNLFIGLEGAASQLDWYESELVPGLLQTEDYARTLIRAYNPDDDEDEVEKRVHVRLARQALLTREPSPALRVVLNEAILRRPVGGRNMMAAQLGRLVELSELPSVSLRVMPFSAGMHAGIVFRSFVMLRFPLSGNRQETEPPTVYVEGVTGDLYLDKPYEIERYSGAFKEMWDLASDESASTALIKQVTREL